MWYVSDELHPIGSHDQESGLRGFFKGNLLHLCRVIPNAAIKYSCFDTYKRWITELRPETAESLRAVNSKRALVNSVLAASMSGTTQISITYRRVASLRLLSFSLLVIRWMCCGLA